MTLLKITQAEVLAGHCMALKFSDGRSGSIDFLEMLSDDLPDIFLPLHEASAFHSFRLVHGTLQWPGELDLAPEYLYFRCFKNEDALRERFVAWGYLETQ